MLTARSVVITVVAIAVLSLLGTIVSLLQPPDHQGLGMDSYGTRAQGYRAVFDTLLALGFDADRNLGPPSDKLEKNSTLVLWGPLAEMVEIEPVYLRRVKRWLNDGGRVVVAPGALRDEIDQSHTPRHGELNPTTVLAELGLTGVVVKQFELPATSGPMPNSTPIAQSRQPASADQSDQDDDSVRSQLNRYFFPELFPTTTIKIESSGSLSQITAGASHLEVPATMQVLEFGSMKPRGTIVVSSATTANSASSGGSASKSPVVAASFAVGSGEVIVVGDPALFDNRLISRFDNSVLAVHLLGEPKQPIVWDEFYHGLTVRGNPLYLLTRGNYALIAVALVLLTAIWVWRQSLFLGPPLAERQIGRRSLAEYVDAMAAFFHRGSGSLPFMLAELRSGVLWSLARKFGMQSDYDQPEAVAAAISRRDPRLARQLLDATITADLMLSQRQRANQRELLQVAKDLVDCL